MKIKTKMKAEKLTREELLQRMAEAYYKLLKAVALLLKDKDIEAGIREGLENAAMLEQQENESLLNM